MNEQMQQELAEAIETIQGCANLLDKLSEDVEATGTVDISSIYAIKTALRSVVGTLDEIWDGAE